MGDFLSGILGTNSGAAVQQNVNPYQALGPLQQQQQALLNQLQLQSSGNGGPNLAQLQLQKNAQMIAQQQATSNAQNRAINPGLAARMSGNEAANLGSNAAANAGIQQAQQQLASQQLLGGVVNSGLNSINQASNINSQIAAGNQTQAGKEVGGLLGGISSFAGMPGGGKAHGGMILPPHLQSVSEIYHMSDGGSVDDGSNILSEPVDRFAKDSSGSSSGMDPQMLAKLAPLLAASQGGMVPTMVSPGEKYLSPDEAKKVASKKESPMKAGEKIPGQAMVPGDSPKNDTVPKSLEEGGVVIPRSIFDSENPEEEAQKFVAKELAKHKKSPEGQFKEALKRAVAGRKNKNAA